MTESDVRAEVWLTSLCDSKGGTACATCHSSCKTCTSGVCDSCKLSGEVKQVDGAYCLPGGTSEGCIGSDELTAVAALFALSDMPLLDETNGLICYRQPVPILNCDPLSKITGPIASNGAGLQPTGEQCCELLEAQWPMAKLWFGSIFPDFTPPTSATEIEAFQLKAVWLALILQFGPSTLLNEASWQELVGVFNKASLVWEQLLGWTSGYLADGSLHSYPVALVPTPLELSLFNRFSEICNSPGCGYQTQCQEVAPGSACV